MKADRVELHGGCSVTLCVGSRYTRYGTHRHTHCWGKPLLVVFSTRSDVSSSKGGEMDWTAGGMRQPPGSCGLLSTQPSPREEHSHQTHSHHSNNFFSIQHRLERLLLEQHCLLALLLLLLLSGCLSASPAFAEENCLAQGSAGCHCCSWSLFGGLFNNLEPGPGNRLHSVLW